SKIYSTPKSKDFVNGVLDKTKLQLIEKGLVNKQGRGLVDS
ncbi:MAG: transcription antitermination factor NusB, partial [Bacteroidetes bacterium]|nr:transcription antitermination factor NusB [Bacteroidota bacterium]